MKSLPVFSDSSIIPIHIDDELSSLSAIMLNDDFYNFMLEGRIRRGDTVFMYVGSPVSAILYKCKVTETDITYQYQDDNLTIKALMKIKLLKRYNADKFTFEVLKDEYGIYAIRGPRGITNSLSAALK